jgi:hypothetical protein
MSSVECQRHKTPTRRIRSTFSTDRVKERWEHTLPNMEVSQSLMDTVDVSGPSRSLKNPCYTEGRTFCKTRFLTDTVKTLMFGRNVYSLFFKGTFHRLTHVCHKMEVNWDRVRQYIHSYSCSSSVVRGNGPQE